jgi:methionyl-tRNA formyltransferase
MRNKIVIITSSPSIKLKKTLFEKVNNEFEIHYIYSQEHLLEYTDQLSKKDVLLSFLSGIIIPEKVLSAIKYGVNIHPAPPQYPGRDVHHFAIFNNVTRYGATAHFIITKVDAGRILDVEYFDVPQGISPCELFEMAKENAYVVLDRILIKILDGTIIDSPAIAEWGPVKYTRKMFLEMCNIPTNLSKDELNKRIFCFHVDGYKNIKLNYHGISFVLES